MRYLRAFSRTLLPGLALLVSPARVDGQAHLAWARAAERSAEWRQVVSDVLGKMGVEKSWAAAPLAFSGYQPAIRLPGGRAGLWAINMDEAVILGLIRDPWLDERLDPIASTKAIARLISMVHRDSAASHIRAKLPGIGRHAPEWEMAMKAGLRLKWASRPGRSAMGHVEIDEFWSLEQLADALGVSRELLRADNPHLLRGHTHPWKKVRVYVAANRVPLGQIKGSIARVQLRSVPIRSNTDLDAIAQSLGIPTATLHTWNPGHSGFLPAGSLVRVPRGLEWAAQRPAGAIVASVRTPRAQ